MNNLIKKLVGKLGVIKFFALKIITLLISLFINVLIVRKLGIDEFGIFSIVLMVVNFATNFGFSWSSSSILYIGGKERAVHGNLNKTFWARNIIIFVSLILVIIVFLIFKDQINNYIGKDLALLILVWLFVSVLEDYLSQYFLAVKKQLLSALLSLTAKFILLIAILTVSFDVTQLLIINIVSHSSVIFYLLGINKKDIGNFEFDQKYFKEVLRFSLWQFFGFSGMYLINFGDIAVIKHFMEIEDVAIYNSAYNLFNAFSNLSFVISSYYAGSITSYMATQNAQKIHSFYYKERYYIVFITLIAHVIFILFSGLIFDILYGTKYQEAVVIFNVLMIGSFFRYISVFYMLFFNTSNRFQVLQLVNIFRAILNVVLSIALIQTFGLIGPALATTVAIVVSTIFLILYCEPKIHKLSKGDGFNG